MPKSKFNSDVLNFLEIHIRQFDVRQGTKQQTLKTTGKDKIM